MNLRHSRGHAKREPHAALPGSVLLVAAADKYSTLWVLQERLPGSNGEPLVCYEFGPVADEAWRTAVALLPRVSPVLWRNVGRGDLNSRQALRIGLLRKPNSAFQFDHMLEGSSFGLSFLLALASEALDLRIPQQFAASAMIDAYGHLSAVDSLIDKVAVLNESAPWVTTLLVAENQLDVERCAALYPSILIQRIEHARDALSLVFHNALDEPIAAGATGLERRAHLIVSFLRLALEPDHTVTDWTPFSRAIDAALTQWRDNLSEHDDRTLRFVRAVFNRRHGVAESLGLPEQDWLERFPRPVRLAIVSKFVLHSAHTRGPRPEQIEQLARELLAAATEAHSADLKLQSALGRLLAVTGRPSEALQLQEDVISGFYDRYRHDQAGEALAECYRLAAALKDSDALRRIEERFSTMLSFGGCDRRMLPLLESARLNARLRLLHEWDDVALARLQAMSLDPSLHWSISYAALRNYVSLLIEKEQSDEILRLVEQALDGSVCFRGDDKPARTYRALIALDLGLASRAMPTARAATEELTNLHPGLVGNIHSGSTGIPLPELLARWYPQ